AWQWRVHTLRTQFNLVLGERARIAREIHDTVLQGMAGVAMQLEGVARKIDAVPDLAKKQLEHVRRQVRQHIDETRESILSVRGGEDTRTLAKALDEFGERLSDGTRHIQVVVHGQPGSARPETERELKRIGQEAIRNAVRHGDATRVRVEVSYGD